MGCCVISVGSADMRRGSGQQRLLPFVGLLGCGVLFVNGSGCICVVQVMGASMAGLAAVSHFILCLTACLLGACKQSLARKRL
jgi:hypothetical protein